MTKKLLPAFAPLQAAALRHTETIDAAAFLGFVGEMSKAFEERLIELHDEMMAASAYVKELLRHPGRKPDPSAYPAGPLKTVFAVLEKREKARQASGAQELAKTAARLAKAA